MRKLTLASFLILLLIGCSDDEPKLSNEEILQKYYWEFVSLGGDGRVVATPPGGSPPTLKIEPWVITLRSDGFYGDVVVKEEGVCRSLGTWTIVDDKTLKLGGKTAIIKKLTKSEFIYVLPDREVRRKSVRKPD